MQTSFFALPAASFCGAAPQPSSYTELHQQFSVISNGISYSRTPSRRQQWDTLKTHCWHASPSCVDPPEWACWPRAYHPPRCTVLHSAALSSTILVWILPSTSTAQLRRLLLFRVQNFWEICNTCWENFHYCHYLCIVLLLLLLLVLLFQLLLLLIIIIKITTTTTTRNGYNENYATTKYNFLPSNVQAWK